MKAATFGAMLRHTAYHPTTSAEDSSTICARALARGDPALLPCRLRQRYDGRAQKPPNPPRCRAIPDHLINPKRLAQQRPDEKHRPVKPGFQPQPEESGFTPPVPEACALDAVLR